MLLNKTKKANVTFLSTRAGICQRRMEGSSRTLGRRSGGRKGDIVPMSEKPHVLLIATDHWPGSLLGVAGHRAIQTPTLDQLAYNGARFTRAYSESPVCVPARRTLMTGTNATHTRLLCQSGETNAPGSDPRPNVPRRWLPGLCRWEIARPSAVRPDWIRRCHLRRRGTSTIWGCR